MYAKFINRKDKEIEGLIEMKYKDGLVCISNLNNSLPHSVVSAFIGTDLVYGPVWASLENICEAKETIDKLMAAE